ncbi:MAG: hypothetical protein C0444_09480 [Microbacterium sp.]|nr:hypothetical protein [Microbacterium sp.]MBA4345891.1 hypothetical protein [Microbacterium sp.]
MSAERERAGLLALSLTRWPVGRLGLALALSMLAVVPMGLVGSASASTVTTSDELAIDLVAAPAGSGIVRPGEPMSVRVTITNTGSVSTGDVLVSLEVDGAAVADSAQLGEWFAGATIATSSVVVASARVSALDPAASAVLDLIVPAADSVFSGSFGARLTTITAASADAPADAPALARDRTAVVWLPDNTTAPVAATTFVAAIATPGESAAFLSAETLAGYTAAGGALTRTLDAAAGRPVLLAIDPRVIASIRLLGVDAPPDAVAFLDRLLAAPNESFVLPWADADPVATITAASVALPRPEGTGVVSSTESNAAQTPAPSPSPDDSLSIDELAEWPATFGGVAWAEAGSLTSAAVSVLTDDGTSVLLAPASSLESSGAVQEFADLRVLRADDALSAAAREASLAVSQQRFDRAMARVSAILAASASTEPSIPAIIPLARDRLAGTDRLIDTIAQTVALPWAAGASVTQALSRPAVSSSVIEPLADEALSGAVRGALDAEANDRTFASIAVNPTAITDLRRLQLLAALSLGWGESSVDALHQFTRDSTTLRSSVRVIESSKITLLADRASLPITVQNDLDVAVRVFVKVEPDSTQLRVLDSRVEALVEPQSQTRALVPVESLTNGQVDITISVRDADDRIVGDPKRVSLNLQAGWETAGTIAIAIALVLLLGFGIARDIRKRRRRRAEPE